MRFFLSAIGCLASLGYAAWNAASLWSQWQESSWFDMVRLWVTDSDVMFANAQEAIRSFLVPLKGSTVGKPLAKVALFYEALNALKISYVPDPKTPFQDVSGKPDTIDYVQFPRETLRRKTGDCDDMTSLMAALLESVGVQVALVDVPGHIFLMANMEESDPSIIGLPIERFVEFQGSYWVPVEMTQLGKNFLAAWQSGTAKIKAAKEKGQIEFISVEESFIKYPPVTLVEADPNRPSFPENEVKETFPVILNQMQNERYESQLQQINDAIKADPVNQMLQVQLGMIHVEGKKMDEAKKLFAKLSQADMPVEVQSSALNNLGNVAYLESDYKAALDYYESAAKLSSEDGRILVNQGRAAWRMGDLKSAKAYFSKAKEMSPDWLEYASDIPAEILPN
jgi:tetratricopeptide (TPR) repeat protein